MGGMTHLTGHRTLILAAAVIAGASMLLCCERGPAGPGPNFVLILTDDMGWMDTHVYGSTFYETPNIDRLAAQGMRFTNAYSAANVCSPTRASILTGKHPARLHLTTWIPGHNFPWAKLKEPVFSQELPLEEITLAEALKPAGYRSASFGKWHLGSEEYYPEKQGFDETFQKTTREPHYLTDRRVTGEAVRFLEANKHHPFFLYVPYYSVHEPIDGPEEYKAAFEEKLKSDNSQFRADYAAMVASQDDNVGRIMDALDEHGLAENTVLIFVSDNGGLSRATRNAPLRGGKGTMYEGGVRVPFIIRWPGVVRAGSTCDAPVTSTDFYPTILELAGLDPPALDGVSLTPLLRETGPISRDALHWHFPHYHGLGAVPYSSIRKGDWKLIEFLEDNRLEVYNLAEDPGEQNDLAGKMPGQAKELQADLDRWLESVDAQMPTLNPGHDPSRADLWKRGDSTRKRTPLP